MSYLIQASEPAADAVRRIVRLQNQRVLELLEGFEADPADRVHRARQTCKRIRALLRLVRPAARYVYQVENRFYRDIQRRIAYARDAEAMVEALDALGSGVAEPALLESVRMLREALAGRGDAVFQERRATLAAEVEACCAELRVAERRLARLPVDHLRRGDLYQGAARTFARCARQFEVVRARPDARALHAWRKDVKYAYHHTNLLAEVMPDYALERGPGLRELAEVLGRHQDLHVLDEFLRRQPDALGIDIHVQRLRRLVADTARALRERALAMGEALFVAAPPPREPGGGEGATPL